MSTWQRTAHASLYAGLLALCASFSVALASSPSAKAHSPRSHQGFGRHREELSLGNATHGTRVQAHQKLRARAAQSFRGKGKKTTVCKETAAEFVCTTTTTY